VIAALNTILLILVFFIGAILGSFLNVLIYRLPKKENFVWGNSYCPQCHHTLGALDLIPILSYLFLGRKCRYCKKPISPRYMLVELLSGGLALASYLAFLPPLAFLLQIDAIQVHVSTASQVGLIATWIPVDFPAYNVAILSALLVFALLCFLLVVTFIDADTMEIPNSLSIWIAALGLVAMVIGPTSQLPWYDHLIGAVAISVPMLLLALFIPGAFGLGDVKLIAAAGLFLGWQLVMVATFIGVLIGGAYGVYLLVTRKKGRKEHFAFGPSLCMGVALSIFFGQQILTWYVGFF